MKYKFLLSHLSSKSKKIFLFIYASVNINSLFIRIYSLFDSRILKIPGGYFGIDGTPRLNLYKRLLDGELKSRNLSKEDESLDKKRRNFWKRIYKKHAPFECCYFKNYDVHKNKYIAQIQSQGFTVIQNFIPENKYLNLAKNLQLLESKLLSQQIKGPNYGFISLKKSDKKIINKELMPIMHYFFGKGFSPNMHLNVYRSLDGLEPYTLRSTNLWHADRFIPCINALYFPFGCSWMPFERLVTSPFIESDDHAKKLQSCYDDLNHLESNPEIYQSLCPENTLIIGFHHILHRKSKIKSPGQRTTVFLDWYDSFGRFSIIKSALKYKFNKTIKRSI